MEDGGRCVEEDSGQPTSALGSAYKICELKLGSKDEFFQDGLFYRAVLLQCCHVL